MSKTSKSNKDLQLLRRLRAVQAFEMGDESLLDEARDAKHRQLARPPPASSAASASTSTSSSSLSAFERDVVGGARRVSPQHWAGTITDQWMVGRVPSGGYVTAVVLACVRGEVAATKEAGDPKRHPDILTANCHFLSATMPGPFACRVEVLKSGRRTGTVEARLYQQDKLCFTALVTTGNLAAAAAAGPNLAPPGSGGPPDLPPAQACVRLDGGDNNARSVRGRVHIAVPERTAGLFGECRTTRPDGTFDEEVLARRTQQVAKGGAADYAGYMSFSDGAPTTLAAAPVFLDASLPPILGVHVTGWVPTINWTVQFKRHPVTRSGGAGGALRFRLSTRRVTGGFLEEDGELWDEAGNLVALSRQLALGGVSQANVATL